MVPTYEERTQLLNAAMETTPISTAILGAVYVEHELEELIRSRLPKIDDGTWSLMLQDNGPLATFSQKIIMGLALRIYGQETRDNLKIISNIRNAFAYSKRLIDFDHDLVKAELKKVSIPKFQKIAHHQIKNLKYGAKDAYIVLCIIISTYLTGKIVESLKAKNRRLKRKTTAPFYSALMRALNPTRLSDLGSLLPPLPTSQNAGPNPPAQVGLLSGLLPYLGEENKKK